MATPTIRLGHAYAWDPTRKDPDNSQMIVVISTDPHELIGMDTDEPRLRRAPNWGSIRYGMLAVELFGETLRAYERAVLDGGTEYKRQLAEAVHFGADVLDLLDHNPQADVPVPPRGEMRPVTFRSVEVVQAYNGWLWARHA